MKIQPVSDLHLEFQKNGKMDIPHLGENVLILAGDINVGLKTDDKWFINLLKHRHVIYVLGNHEFYQNDLFDLNLKTQPWQEKINEQAATLGYGYKIHVLQNTSVIIDNVKFMGGTLWTNFNDGNEGVMYSAKNTLNDYRWVSAGLGKRIQPEIILNEFNKTLEFIEAELSNNPDNLKTVVVTHHLPSIKSVHEQYLPTTMPPTTALDALKMNQNYLYFSNIDDTVAKADLWVHGHTHSSADYSVGKCRVVCNPYGYDGYEINKDYLKSFIVEV